MHILTDQDVYKLTIDKLKKWRRVEPRKYRIHDL